VHHQHNDPEQDQRVSLASFWRAFCFDLCDHQLIKYGSVAIGSASSAVPAEATTFREALESEERRRTEEMFETLSRALHGNPCRSPLRPVQRVAVPRRFRPVPNRCVPVSRHHWSTCLVGSVPRSRTLAIALDTNRLSLCLCFVLCLAPIVGTAALAVSSSSSSTASSSRSNDDHLFKKPGELGNSVWYAGFCLWCNVGLMCINIVLSFGGH
jgi:hypothetical protein